MNRSKRGRARRGGKISWPLIIVGGACVVLAAAIMAQTKPKTTAQAASGRKAGSSKETTVVEVKPAERKPLSYYTSGVRGDLFTMPGAKEIAVIRPEPPKVEPTPPPAPEVIDPFADYAYTGTVVMGDEFVALIENAKTKEGTYLRRGDQFMGGTVSEITDKGVTVTVAGTPRILNKTDEFKLTPLDKDAEFRTATQGRPGQPGQPGMPGMGGPFGMPGMPGMSPGMPGGGMGFPGMQNLPASIQQRFQGMSPEQMQQMRNRFMNRSFEGGQRRRRFF